MSAAKRFLAVQSFTDKTDFRKNLIEECVASKIMEMECKHIGPGAGSRTSFAQDQIQQTTAEAWFCIQPFGDTPTRAATFDCIMAGAIPVFFDALMIDLLPFADKVPWEDAMVVLPEADHAGASMLQALREVPVEARLKKLAQLHKAHAILQYSVNPDHRQVQFSSRSFQLPQDDAFTSTFKGVLQNLCGRGMLTSRCKLEKPHVYG